MLERPEGIDDHVWYVLNNEPYRRRYAWLTSHVIASPMIDVGCGQGYATTLMARAVDEVFAIERDPELVETARCMFELNDAGNVRLLAGDAYALPFPDDTFASGAITDVLEHLTDPVAALAELARVLQHGAVLLVTCPAFGEMRIPGHIQDFRQEDVAALLSSTGFTPIELVLERPFQYAAAVKA